MIWADASLTHDAMVSPASVSATARAYGVVPVFVEGTAHLLPIEAEPQAFAKLLIHWDQHVIAGDSRLTPDVVQRRS